MHRHNYKGRKLGRKRGARVSLLKNLAKSILLYEEIRTTLVKAKEVVPLVERLINIGKKGDLSAIREIKKSLSDEIVALKIVKEISPRFKGRNGGYLRILQIEPRLGDGAKMALVKFSPFEEIKGSKEENTETQEKEAIESKKRTAKIQKATKKPKEGKTRKKNLKVK